MKERILAASTIDIWTSPRATRADAHLAHAIACGLKKLGKRVSMVSQAPLGANTFSVTLRGLAPRVGQVAYEKAGEDLKLHFTLQKGGFSAENVSLNVAPPSELTIIVGDNTSQYNHQKVHALVLELLLNHKEPSLRLLGITLFHMEQPTSKSLYTIPLAREDFQTALATPKDIPLVVQDLRDEFGNDASYLFFAENSRGGSQALLWTSQPQLPSQLAQGASTHSKGNWTLWTQPKNLVSP